MTLLVQFGSAVGSVYRSDWLRVVRTLVGGGPFIGLSVGERRVVLLGGPEVLLSSSTVQQVKTQS